MDDSAARVYSARLGAISPGQFQLALDRFGLGQFVSAEPIFAGNFGQNVYLTSTAGAYVLRGAPFGPDQFLQERYFTDQLHAHTGAPVPWPYRLDPAIDIFGWPYVVMPRMPGIHPYNAHERDQLSTEDRLAIARAMGETLAEMQRLISVCAGRYDAATQAVRPFAQAFGDWVIAMIRDCVEEAAHLSDATTDGDRAWVETVIARNRRALEVPFVPCFVMQDFKEDNAVAERVADTWRISGVFDYQDAYFGDGETDLARPVAMYFEDDPGLTLARAFVQAYAERKALRPGFAERFKVYSLLERVLCWQFGQRHGVWWKPELSLQAWARPYIDLQVFGSGTVV
ncbi:MAG: aminoglycoside phosphotransferase family protein [Anaerolineae bacterium]|jgi:Ser/Thr protein kinase RdoA (MazF antagonist)|nr:aminoglycoside phosphotransferase family protein [Anaerolineae bacterium]